MITHIHDALNAVINSPGKYTVLSLGNSLKEEFGQDVMFSNCSGMEIKADEVVNFLYLRNKIDIKEGRLFPLVAQTCGHH